MVLVGFNSNDTIMRKKTRNAKTIFCIFAVIMTEKELTEGIKRGNSATYRQLFLQYYAIILRFLQKFVGQSEAASDMAQDIFMKVWINRHRLDPDKSIKSYLYTLAKNEALNYMKRARHAINSTLSDDLPASDKTENLVEYVELRTALGRKIDEMPPMRKLVFQMSRYSQLSNQDIADKLNISVRTVEKHLELARKDIENIKPA